MKICRLGKPGEEVPAVFHQGKYYDLSQLTRDIDSTVLSDEKLRTISQAVESGNLKQINIGEDMRFGAPISKPGKIVCIGLNYSDHAAETGAELPKEPVVFMKDPMTLIGPFDQVVIPKGSMKTDWEIELCVVIGKKARYLESPLESLDYVAGYSISNDVSEREFQLERGGQWDKGKSCESFNPLGPFLVTKDEISNPQNLDLKLSVNGKIMQHGSTKNQIFSVEFVIWYLSQFMVLYPGDMINTGTPAGVALGLPGNPYLREGDVIELEISNLGTSRQKVVKA